MERIHAKTAEGRKRALLIAFIVLISAAAVALLIVGGTALFTVVNQNGVNALVDRLEQEGPFAAEASVWAAEGNTAFLVGTERTTDSSRISDVTAYFNIGGEWKSFEMRTCPGRRALAFLHSDNEEDVSDFECAYDLKEGKLTMTDFKLLQGRELPSEDGFVFTRVGSADETEKLLPEDMGR